MATLLLILTPIVAASIFLMLLPSIRLIGSTEIGLPMKRFPLENLTEDNPIAFNGDQDRADLLVGGSGQQSLLVDALLAMVMRGR